MNVKHIEYIEYINNLLDGIDNSQRNRLKNNIYVKCRCNSSCLLSNYFSHCKSLKHSNYLLDNDKNYIYCIEYASVTKNGLKI